MSRAEQYTKNDSAQVRALVNRQVQAWESAILPSLPTIGYRTESCFLPGGHPVKKDMLERDP
jgi:hypothetical protein